MTDDRIAHRNGLVLGALAAVLLGAAVAVSRFAYDAGASGILVAGFRTLVMTVVFGVALRVSRQRLTVPRELVPVTVLNGVLMAVITYGNIGAVEFISVGLASLLFFTFPILIAIVVMVLGIERVSVARLAAITVAFAGLAVMLGVSIGGADWRGIAFSLVASVCTAANAILVARCFQRVGVMVVTLHFSVVALVVLALVGALFAEVRLPETLPGWGGVLGVACFQALATPMYLRAMTRVGALQVGMVANVQPVVAIVIAWVLFGEVLSRLQALGGTLVLLSIAAMQWHDLRSRRRAPAASPRHGADES